MFCFRLGWLKWAGQDDNFSIRDFLLHLWVGEFLVNNDAFNELRIFDRTTSFGNDFNKIKVDIFALEICNVEDRFHSQISVVILAFAHNF